MREPPPKGPPKFKVGDKVWVDAIYRSGGFLTEVLEVKEMDEEWLVRTAYAAGYYTYVITDHVGGGETAVSGNLLELALIDTLASLADEDVE